MVIPKTKQNQAGIYILDFVPHKIWLEIDLMELSFESSGPKSYDFNIYNTYTKRDVLLSHDIPAIKHNV